MAAQTFASFAQNGEDVVLWRALGNIPDGRYVEVGANDPTDDSISRAFYDAGWRGITIEPVHEYAERHRAERPGDRQVEIAITDSGVDTITLHQVTDTGLSTTVDSVAAQQDDLAYERVDVQVPAARLDSVLQDADWSGSDIHFMTIDVEGAEAEVLGSIDLRAWRPWVLVVESTEPRSTVPTHDQWEGMVLSAGYQFCLFDGLSRFYVAEEHAEALRPMLSYPSCPLDRYTTWTDRRLLNEREQAEIALAETIAQRDQAVQELIRWRSAAVRRWDPHVLTLADNDRTRALTDELSAIHQTVSWRVTRPLRAVRGIVPGQGR
jgi:FkbM family methyltransferase